MTICPIALAVGCQKCPAFKICPVKTLLGDAPKAAAAKPAAAKHTAAKKKAAAKSSATRSNSKKK